MFRSSVFALHQEDELEPYAEHVQERFSAWLAEQEKAGKKISEERIFWLEKIKEHIVGSLSIEREDFEYTPFKEKGGIGRPISFLVRACGLYWMN